MTGLRLWSNKVPLDDLGPVGDDLSISTVFGDGGCGVDQITWSMGLPRGFTHPALQQGAVVELRRGPLVVATVINDEPDVDAWKFTAKGLIHRAADFIAVNSAGTPTNKLADAVNAAVANGLEWKVPTDLTNATVSIDSVDQVLTVADLLNRYCAQTNQRWGITGSGWLRFYTDPTTPRWVLTPDAPSLASARGQVSRLRVRYATSVDDSGSPATLATVVVGSAARGVVESFQDITNYGALTEPQATTIAQGMLAQQAPQQSFTSGITPGPGQLTNIGDVPMDGGLWLVALDVAEGAMVRSQGWRNPDVGVSGMGFDWIAGGATWSKPSGLTITPLAMAATVFGDNMAEIRAGIGAAQTTASTALAVGTPDYLQSLITPSSVSTQGATMPASAVIGDIWINPPNGYVCTTPYTSDGTMANWTQAIDPRTVALIGATATAVFAADNANAAATAAQASADGKNTIWYLASAPSSSKAGVIGDTAFVFSGGQITAQYKLTSISGSTYTWSWVQLNSAVIANLDVGKITGAVASFVYAAITQLDVLTINATTTTWTAYMTSTIQPQTTITGSGISTQNAYNGASLSVKIKSGLAVSGGGIYVESGSGLEMGNSRIYDSGDAIHLAPWNTSTGTGFIGSGVVLDGLYTGGSVVSLQVSGSGHMVIASSTRRFKTQIRPILERYPLATLRAVAAVLFRWIDHPEIDDATKDSGFIAEQIAALGIEELVIRTGAGDILGVHYDRAVAFCWAMTAAAWDEIDTINARLAALEAS